MKVGAEPKKVAILVALLVVAVVVIVMNSGSGIPEEAQRASTARPTPAGDAPIGAPVSPAPAAANAPRPQTTRQARGRSTLEFRPTLRRRPEDRRDPMTIDPTLRVDYLEKLQTVKVEGMRRNLFEFGSAPAPKPTPEQIAAARVPVPAPFIGPQKPVVQPPPPEPPKPQAPPVPFKFYGYSTTSGQAAKRAFFVEGDEIHVVTEGDMVKKRYKIVRIGVNSVVVEDTQFNSQQTVPLEEQPG